MRLAVRFDARFAVIADRWDDATYGKRSVEQLKQRYYDVCNTLTRLRYPSEHSKVKGIREFDADHEKKRKMQLDKIMGRSAEMIEEETYLSAELKKIEVRKREREKKTRDLQRLISAADGSDVVGGPVGSGVAATKKTCDRGRKGAICATGGATVATGAFGRSPSTGGQRGRPSASSLAAAAAAAAAAVAATSPSNKGAPTSLAISNPTTSNGAEAVFAMPGPIVRKLSMTKTTTALEAQRINKDNGSYMHKKKTKIQKSPMSLTKIQAQSLTMVKDKKSLARGRLALPKVDSNGLDLSLVIGIDTEGVVTNADKYAIKGIRHIEIRQPGISLMSHRLKLPTNIGVKKIKEIEQSLMKLDIPLKPMATEDVIEVYNEVRSDVVIIQQLSNLLASAEFDLESSKQRFLASKPALSLKRKSNGECSPSKKIKIYLEKSKDEYNRNRCELLGISFPPKSEIS